VIFGSVPYQKAIGCKETVAIASQWKKLLSFDIKSFQEKNVAATHLIEFPSGYNLIRIHRHCQNIFRH
jgi:hypothetical protein